MRKEIEVKAVRVSRGGNSIVERQTMKRRDTAFIILAFGMSKVGSLFSNERKAYRKGVVKGVFGARRMKSQRE